MASAQLAMDTGVGREFEYAGYRGALLFVLTCSPLAPTPDVSIGSAR